MMPDHEVAYNWAMLGHYVLRADRGNLLRMRILGAPGAGKRTLAHQLLSGNLVTQCTDHMHNEATGLANTDIAVIVVDVAKGFDQQIRRHCQMADMMGVRHFVMVLNKMDLIGFDHEQYQKCLERYCDIGAISGFLTVQFVPMSALSGENLLDPGINMSWYSGASLMPYLCNLEIENDSKREAFRMASISSDNSALESPCVFGQIVEGTVRRGDSLRVLPAGVHVQVKSLCVGSEDLAVAQAGETVTLVLEEKGGVAPGDVLAADNAPPEVADQFEARLFWLSQHAMTPGRQYLMKVMNREVAVIVTDIKYRHAKDTSAHLAAKTLELDEMGVVNLSTSSPIVFEPFRTNRALGSFMLSDRLSGAMVGIGCIEFALRRASNIHWQALEINKKSRSDQKNQEAKCIWFTGLSGSGKSTIANFLDKRLHGDGKHTYLLDGDNVRHGLNRDLGFTEADRVENIRRVAEVAKLMVDAGLIVLVSFISPFRAERRMARDLFTEGEFVEVFVDTPIAECEKRDVKGLYAKARRGDLKNFTGIDSPYEAPDFAEIHLHTIHKSPENCVEEILSRLG